MVRKPSVPCSVAGESQDLSLKRAALWCANLVFLAVFPEDVRIFRSSRLVSTADLSPSSSVPLYCDDRTEPISEFPSAREVVSKSGGGGVLASASSVVEWLHLVGSSGLSDMMGMMMH